MMELVIKFGGSAGKIWQTLNSEKVASELSLKKKTGLKNDEFYGGIGWLARENKIRREEGMYKLGETNLTNEIGSNAGKIWQTLKMHGEQGIAELSKLTNLREKELFASLGWLARENKIEIDNITTKWKLR